MKYTLILTMKYILILVGVPIYGFFVLWVVSRLKSPPRPKAKKLRVDGILYDSVDATYAKVGDLIWDTRDNTFGACDMRMRDSLIVRHNKARQEVPIWKARKLVPTIDSIN